MSPRPVLHRSRLHRTTSGPGLLAAGLSAVLLLAAGCSGERPELVLDRTTTTALPGVSVTQPTIERRDCSAAPGPGPWQAVIRAGQETAVECTAVGAHQRIEFVNETVDPVSFELARATVTVEPGSTLVTEPAGTILQPGLTVLAASPHPVPAIWLADPTENRLADQPIGLDAIGPITVGMTPTDMTAALGGAAIIVSDAECYVTSIDGDPYSPLFTVRDGTVAAMQVFTPGQLTRSGIGIGAEEGDVLTAYGAQIESVPSADGDPDRKLLVFVPTDQADQVHRLAFSVDGGIVSGIRLGLTDTVLNDPDCGG